MLTTRVDPVPERFCEKIKAGVIDEIRAQKLRQLISTRNVLQLHCRDRQFGDQRLWSVSLWLCSHADAWSHLSFMEEVGQQRARLKTDLLTHTTQIMPTMRSTGSIDVAALLGKLGQRCAGKPLQQNADREHRER